MEDDRKFRIPDDTQVLDTVYPMSDSLPSSAWHRTEKIIELHRRGVDGRGVIVGINDTAGETDHPFLPKALAGRDFTGSRNGLRDVNGHGTHCAGIVIAIAPGCSLVMSKVLSDGGSGSSSWINAGRVWLAKQGCMLVSESLGDGGGPPIQADLTAFDQAYAAGVFLCNAALGNAGFNGATTIGRPGSYSSHCHGIAAHDRNMKIAGFSSGGPQARFSAPGVDIVSCRPGGGWVGMNGTSMATPAKTAVDALVTCWRRQTGLPALRGPKEWEDFYVMNALVDDLGAPGRDPRHGFGAINVTKAIDFLLDNTSL